MAKTLWYLQVWRRHKWSDTGYFADFGKYSTFSDAKKKADTFVSSCRILKVVDCTTYWRTESGVPAGR